MISAFDKKAVFPPAWIATLSDLVAQRSNCSRLLEVMLLVSIHPCAPDSSSLGKVAAAFSTLRKHPPMTEFVAHIRESDKECQPLECHLDGVARRASDRNDVDILRIQISQACLDFPTTSKSIYQLTVPTGARRHLIVYASLSIMRRMHHLATPVIILDKVQTFPIKTIHMLNVESRFLVHDCGTTVVLCTATQPSLEKIEASHRAHILIYSA